MRNNVPLALLIVVAGAAAVIFFAGSSSNEPASVSGAPAAPPSEKPRGGVYEPKMDAQGAVTITVAPLNLSAVSQEWEFDVVMSTHSVELDQDMVKVAVLVDDSDKEYQPLRWEGAPPGGHHREGVLIFGAIAPMPQTVELSIKGIDGIPERSFKWNTDERL